MNKSWTTVDVAAHVISWGIVFPVGLILVLFFLGSIFEGIAMDKDQRDRCQRQATTPYEHSRCR